jgi:hypothetical protein
LLVASDFRFGRLQVFRRVQPEMLVEHQALGHAVQLNGAGFPILETTVNYQSVDSFVDTLLCVTLT